MGGRARITVVEGTDEQLDSAVALADRCEARWSRFLPESDLSRLARAGGTPVSVDPLTTVLIEAMRDGVALTDGDFDPTLLPSVVAVGYGASVVAPDLVTTLAGDAHSGGDLNAIRLDGATVRLPRGMTLDAGGIGKGFAADLVAAHLIEAGAAGALVEISGDLVAAGRAPDGIAWRLDVENPFATEQALARVRFVGGALVTSSQRKRRFDTDRGVRHHLIDPRTGDSAVTDVQTVSVIAATGARGEAIAKSGFLRSPDDFLGAVPEWAAAALLVLADGSIRTSSNWEDYAC
jgi:thiamine biosynthesis lipoprotein